MPGDALDFWRVAAVEPTRRLQLYAEMKVPGKAWLEFRVEPEGDGARVRQTAVFHPNGLAGLLYWKLSTIPAHREVEPFVLVLEEGDGADPMLEELARFTDRGQEQALVQKEPHQEMHEDIDWRS